MGKIETCNFCGLTKDNVKFMVNGPGGLYICDKCIEACMELWKDFQREEKQRAAYTINQRIIDNLTE